MKLLLLFLVFVFAPAIVSPKRYDDQKLIFNVTVSCDIPNIREWCASIYFFDMDTFSKHDPKLWVQTCSRNKTINFVINTVKFIGDGAFDTHEEIAYQAYHTCSSLNAQNYVNQLIDCQCSHSQGFVSVQYDVWLDTAYYNQFIYWPHSSFPITYGHCDMPEAFRDLDEEPLPHARCSWNNKFDDRLLSWSTKTD